MHLGPTAPKRSATFHIILEDKTVFSCTDRWHRLQSIRVLARIGAASIAAVMLILVPASLAQTKSKTPAKKTTPRTTAKKPAPSEITSVPDLPPFRADTRIYQARAQPGSYTALTDQVFKLTTANLDDEEKWVNAFAKVYPGFQFGLIQSAPLRVARSSKPTRLVLGNAMNRSLEVAAFGAFNEGDGKVPGTTAIVEVNLDFGRPEQLSLAIQTFALEEGKTYFFAVPHLKFNPSEYAAFLRPGFPATPFEGKDTFIIVAMSIQLNPAPPTAVRVIVDQAAQAFQASATKQVQPQVPLELTRAGLGGRVRAYVEVGPDGLVKHAMIVSSAFPEVNTQVLDAVRKWEFPLAEFATDKRPVASVLVFDFPVAPTTQ
jgi:TonB family protein